LDHNKRFSLILGVCISFILSACSQGQDGLLTYHRDFVMQVEQKLSLNLPSGKVQILGADQETIEISGMLPADVHIEESSDGITLSLGENSRQNQLGNAELQVTVPNGLSIEINTYSADITLMDFQGNLKAVSVAGDISAKGLSGDILLKSGRGDVSVENCEGDVRVLGEHGVLELVNVQGVVSSATIMGTIDFKGSIDNGDDIFLETDHGPVKVVVFDPMNFQLKAWTASGEVACMIPGLMQTVDGCVGNIGAEPAGKLTIKTVSGEIWIDQLP